MRYSQKHLLSSQGSDRGTAYDPCNKIVSLAGKTHVVWTDAVAFTRGRTFDHASGQWGPTVAIGEGCDNHNTPGLTADRDGRLHVAYGPHGMWDQGPGIPTWPTGSFRYAVSAEPNSLAGLETTRTPFGHYATYGCIVSTPHGECIVYRGGERPYSVMFQKTRTLGRWSCPRPLIEQEIESQYTQYMARLVCAPDGTLYAAGHIYAAGRGHSLGVAVLRSPDGGETWTDMSGLPAATPVAYGPRFAAPHPPAEFDPRLGGLAVDARGRLWALTHAAIAGCHQLILSRWEHDRWISNDLAGVLPEPWGFVGGPMGIDTRGRIHLAVTAVDRRAVEPGKGVFAHASTEVFHLCSADDGRTFECRQISETDPATPNWLPTVSQAGPFHSVEHPAILYTHGRAQKNEPGMGCRHTVETDIYCVFVED